MAHRLQTDEQMKIQRNDFMRLVRQENQRPQKNRGGYKLNPTRKPATAREMMNQLSLLERRRFLETMMIIMKQLPNNVVIVKIQAKILNKVGDIFLLITELVCREGYSQRSSRISNKYANQEQLKLNQAVSFSWFRNLLLWQCHR